MYQSAVFGDKSRFAIEWRIPRDKAVTPETFAWCWLWVAGRTVHSASDFDYAGCIAGSLHPIRFDRPRIPAAEYGHLSPHELFCRVWPVCWACELTDYEFGPFSRQFGRSALAPGGNECFDWAHVIMFDWDNGTSWVVACEPEDHDKLGNEATHHQIRVVSVALPTDETRRVFQAAVDWFDGICEKEP